MSDPAIIAEIADALRDEFAEVSEHMIEAASRAEHALLVETLSNGRTWPRSVPEAQRYAVLWEAMLAAKLGERA